MASSESEFDKIYSQAAAQAFNLEPWPGYYLAKRVETEILIKRFNFSQNYVGLELGCGNAFQSALLASLSKRIFATDLSREDRCTHSVGIKKARELVGKLNIKNLTLVSCSATSLPFNDNYFDFVFSSSVLEHISQRALTLSEIRRVLKPGGHLITILPTHMPSIYAFPHVFLYCLARSFKLIFPADNSFVKDYGKESRQSQVPSLFYRFRQNHPSFPLPEPHGTYSNIASELLSQLPDNSRRLLKNNGFKIKESFAVCLVPWLLIEPFSTKIAAKMYEFTKNINIKLSTLKNLEYISYLVGIIADKGA